MTGSWGWTYYKYLYSPSQAPDLTVGCLVPPGPRQGLVTALSAPGPEGGGCCPCFAYEERDERRVGVMLFVTAIPGGAGAVVKCLMLSDICFLHKPDLLTHSYYTHTDLSC